MNARFCVALAALCAGMSLCSLCPAQTPDTHHLTAPPAVAKQWEGLWSANETISFTGQPEDQDEKPPLTAEYQQQHEQLLKSAAQGKAAARNLSAACLPPGMPSLMAMQYPIEIIVQNHQVTMLHEIDSQVRRIYTDGRGHDPDGDPAFNGDSIGHWEGDTLVVETVGLRANTRVDRYVTHSDQLKIVERIRLRDKNTLEDRITLTDPKAFTSPWSAVRTYKRRPEWRMEEYVCEENNRDADTGGNERLSGPP